MTEHGLQFLQKENKRFGLLQVFHGLRKMNGIPVDLEE